MALLTLFPFQVMVKVNAVLPQALASNIGYPVAPHEQKRVGGGYNAPPPQSYSAPPPQGKLHELHETI